MIATTRTDGVMAPVVVKTTLASKVDDVLYWRSTSMIAGRPIAANSTRWRDAGPLTLVGLFHGGVLDKRSVRVAESPHGPIARERAGVMGSVARAFRNGE